MSELKTNKSDLEKAWIKDASKPKKEKKCKLVTPEEVSPDKARHSKKEQVITCMICDLKDDFPQEEKNFQNWVFQIPNVFIIFLI